MYNIENVLWVVVFLFFIAYEAYTHTHALKFTHWFFNVHFSFQLSSKIRSVYAQCSLVFIVYNDFITRLRFSLYPSFCIGFSFIPLLFLSVSRSPDRLIDLLISSLCTHTHIHSFNSFISIIEQKKNGFKFTFVRVSLCVHVFSFLSAQNSEYFYID